ncbi:hypothetical protein [Dongshaea marina]|uniref:hypothetical protein n=1 Tax=Dongshaea marina TaxID=2047966 RepID=UPI000D3EC679|nr:hypothetical protein [Dongshaea marina]
MSDIKWDVHNRVSPDEVTRKLPQKMLWLTTDNRALTYIIKPLRSYQEPESSSIIHQGVVQDILSRNHQIKLIPNHFGESVSFGTQHIMATIELFHQPQSFKVCPMCSQTWNNRDVFLQDPALTLNGYQADLEQLDEGLFLFTHDKDGCHSTMAVEVRDFKDLYTGENYQKSRSEIADCPGYCDDKHELRGCDHPCEAAFARELISIIQDAPKKIE